MISSSFYPHIGGGEQQALLLSQKLIERDWSVKVLTRRHNPQYPYLPAAFEKHEGVPVYRMFSPGPNKMGTLGFILSSLVYLARHGRKAVYHAHGIGAPAMIAILAAHLFDGKSIVKLRSGASYYKALYRSKLRRAMLDHQFQAADRLITVNQSLLKALIEWQVLENRVLYLPNSIDTQKYRPPVEEERVVARKRIISEAHPFKDVLVLYVGRLAYLKGVDILLSAWASLPAALRAKSKLLLVGDGPEKDELIAYANGLKTATSVQFLGRQTDVLKFYWASDFLVLPSRAEGLSNTMLEAMSCGLPVVCTEVGGSTDWVRSEINGLLVPREDVTSLSQAFRWMFENCHKWKSMGSRARATVARDLSLEQIVPKLEQAYLDLDNVG